MTDEEFDSTLPDTNLPRLDFTGNLDAEFPLILNAQGRYISVVELRGWLELCLMLTPQSYNTPQAIAEALLEELK
jgi:hypothetical protein